MTARVWLCARCASVALCAALSSGTVQSAGGTPQFRLIGFDVTALPRVRALLDARDESGETPTLQADHFRVDDGDGSRAAQKILKFREVDQSLALVVVVDVSPSMAGMPLDAVRRGVAQLVSRKREGDRTAILSFADDVAWEATWDASDAEKQDALRNLETRGNRSRLYDAVWVAMDAFSKLSGAADAPMRMCILVMSDGHDEGSGNSIEQVSTRLERSRIRLDGVGLARSPRWVKNLQQLTIGGFGAFRTTTTPQGLTDLLEDGLDHVLDAPVIEFDESGFSADGRMHQVSIEHVPTMWHDETQVLFPNRLSLVRPATWIAGGTGVVVVFGALVVLVRRGRRRRAAPPVPAAPAVAAVGALPVSQAHRTSTVVESSRRSTTVVEPTAVSTVPPRQATILAPSSAPWPGVAELVAMAGPYAGQRFRMDANEFWIGSSPNNHLCLSQDPSVSGNHACIRREERFHRVFDNGSLNGTYVNGRLIGQEPTLVRSGDRICIGQSDFAVVP
jgi:hypothetical protein